MAEMLLILTEKHGETTQDCHECARDLTQEVSCSLQSGHRSLLHGCERPYFQLKHEHVVSDAVRRRPIHQRGRHRPSWDSNLVASGCGGVHRTTVKLRDPIKYDRCVLRHHLASWCRHRKHHCRSLTWKCRDALYSSPKLYWIAAQAQGDFTNAFEFGTSCRALKSDGAG